MRKFIVSDLHGNGDVYDSIMGYLDNIAEVEKVHLYLNGDLIDRGLDSFRMLEDVRERVSGKGNVRIHYLGGNHELMMYQALKKRKPGRNVSHWCDWMMNGGWVIEGELDAREDGEEKYEEYKHFLGELNLYHVFDETIMNQPLLLVHAQAPKKVIEHIPMNIKDNDLATFNTVWMRREEREQLFFGLGKVIGLNRVGLEGYFTIIGHTPVLNKRGFMIAKDAGYMNIDGGCAGYAVGQFQYNKVPLLEVKDNHVEILVFNHNNEIIHGYFYDGDLQPMGEEEIDHRKKYIDHQFDGQEEEYKKKILEIVNL